MADMKVDEVAAHHGHDFVPRAEEFACLSELAEVPTSGVQIFGGDHYAAVYVAHPLQFRECETFDSARCLT